ncbi:MFS transporter [Allorhizocola rhizosphaerae]|uniref:MFS transporter n=1 Tax=Allorhizocola rhizosphaerae TaxID=1872709 RepID=UPI000E3BA937|nr:MFS transporter [Allorhizocola rhizosphaerae]
MTVALPRLLIAVLAVTQTVGYGVLSYSFAVLLTPMAAEFGAGIPAVTGAFTVAIVAAAVAAIPVGRWLDRHGGRLLLTVGSVAAVAAVMMWSQVTQLWQLYAVFVLIGLTTAATLYEASFPVIVAATDPSKRDMALLVVTIVAGFASSIFFPLTALLLERHGWRTALLILAAVLAVVTIPGHLLAVPGRRAHRAQPRAGAATAAIALRDKRFWILTVGFVAHSAAVSAVGVLLVGYLQRAGHTAAVAATLAGLLGVLSVTGRLTTTGLSKRYGMTSVAAGVFLIQAAGVAALPLLGSTVAGAAACVIAFGLGFGVATIARPAIVADRYGTNRYATIAGVMTLPVTLAKAGGPLAASSLTDNMFATLTAVACAVSAVSLMLASRVGRPALEGQW